MKKNEEEADGEPVRFRAEPNTKLSSASWNIPVFNIKDPRFDTPPLTPLMNIWRHGVYADDYNYGVTAFFREEN